MGTYWFKDILQAWECEKLTPEQAIGQLLQLHERLEERVEELETRISRLNRVAGSNGHQVKGERRRVRRAG